MWIQAAAMATALAADPIAGVRFTPLSRADLVWVDEERTSGTVVGEFDGTVRPDLQAFGGAWLGEHVGLVGSLGIARLQSTTWTGEVWRQRHWGVIRPELSVRYALTERALLHPTPWLVAGLYGDVPSARDTSNAFSPDEQQAADEAAFTDRARLGGIGGRAGAGVDYRVAPGVALGATTWVRYHHGMLRGPDVRTISSWLVMEAALLLTFEWGSEPGDDPGE